VETTIAISDEFKGIRLDKALAAVCEEYSRTSIQGWLDAGRVRLADEVLTRRYQVKGGERVVIDIPEPLVHEWIAQSIPLDIVFEDEQVLVVNKEAGMVVHPGAGNTHGTLLNALIEHCEALRMLPRAGIVHRLDKDTSGLLVVAKTQLAQRKLTKQFKSRTAGREYLAVTEGRLISGGKIDVPVGRHPKNRTRMAAGVGKPAVSHYRIVSRYRHHSLVRVRLDTGRTHQIRVHFMYAGFPLVGDREYGGNLKLPPGASDELIQTLRGFKRQALHAESLRITHPESGEECHWHRGIPSDMRELIRALKIDDSNFAK